MKVFRNLKGIFATIACSVAIVTAAVTPALATDGVIEINHAKIMAHGGYPYVITQPGSYRLTSNLTVPNENTSGIKVNVSHVTIDLGGFAIQGPVVCTGQADTLACAPIGGGEGIVGAIGTRDVSVFKGSVTGMGNSGIDLNDDSRIEDVTATGNGDTGIYAHTGIVRNDVATYNYADGVMMSEGIIDHVTSQYNYIDGLYANSGTVMDSFSGENGGHGLHIGDRVVFRGSAFIDNGGGTLLNNGTTLLNGGGNLCGAVACP